jgi:hypothetical protein
MYAFRKLVFNPLVQITLKIAAEIESLIGFMNCSELKTKHTSLAYYNVQIPS